MRLFLKDVFNFTATLKTLQLLLRESISKAVILEDNLLVLKIFHLANTFDSPFSKLFFEPRNRKRKKRGRREGGERMGGKQKGRRKSYAWYSIIVSALKFD